MKRKSLLATVLVGGCMTFPSAFSLPIKVLAIAETLKVGNPHLSYKMKDKWVRSVNLALEDYKETYKGRMTFDPDVKFYLEESDPAVLINKIADSNAMTTLGFAFANEALIAANTANERSISYVTPTGSLDRLFALGHIRSLGLEPANGVRHAVELISKSYKGAPVLLISAGDRTNQRDYMAAFRNAWKRRELKPELLHEVTYMSNDLPLAKIVTELQKYETTPVVVIAGYAFETLDIIKYNIKQGIKAVYVTPSQWSHTSSYVRESLKQENPELYCISDFHFYSGDNNQFFVDSHHMSEDKTYIEHKKMNTEFFQRFREKFRDDPEGLDFSIYDATRLFLTIMDRPETNSRMAFTKAFNEFGIYSGVSSIYNFQAGKSSKLENLLKWKDGKFHLVDVFR